MSLEAKKQQTRYHRNNFRGFEVRRKVRFIFSMPKETLKGKDCPFCGYKQRNQVCFVDLQCQLEEHSYG